MNILFITIAKIKDINERGIYTDLIRKFDEEGHNIFVVSPSERKYNETTSLKITGNVQLLSIWTFNFQKTNLFEKSISTLTFDTKFKNGIKRYLNNIDFQICIYTTPPITYLSTLKYIKKRYNPILYLLLKDIFPQNAVDLNMINKKGIIYKYFRKKEEELYKISDYIGCLSKANVEFILNNNNYIKTEKIEINPNTIELNKVLPKDNETIYKIKNKYKIPKNSLLFFYGGNLGKPQGLNFLIKILESNIHKSEIFFLIIGDGTEYKKLLNFYMKFTNPNFLILKTLPKIEFDKLITIADIGLIFLDPRFTIPNLPSRLLSYLENSMPIIAATDSNTDLKSIIEVSNCGFWNLNGDLKSFNNSIDKYLNDKKLINEQGRNARNLIEKNFEISKTYSLIINKVPNGKK